MASVHFTKKAYKSLSQISALDQKTVLKKITQLVFPLHLNNVKRLSGVYNHYRLRVGNIRVIFEVMGQGEIWILMVAYRKDVYKKL